MATPNILPVEDVEKIRAVAEHVDRMRVEHDERKRLRDHFAAAALTGILDKTDAGNELAAWWPEMACRAAYRWADAMLAVRDEK